VGSVKEMSLLSGGRMGLDVHEVVGVGKRIDEGKGIIHFLATVNLDTIFPNHK
jgi:hypothetical protein